MGPPDAGDVSRNVARGISAMVGERAALKDARQLWFLPNYAGWKPLLYERFFGTLLGAALRTREEASIYGLLGDVLRFSHSVLEVGCGTGNYTVPVGHCCARMVAVDASPEMLLYTRGRLDQEGLRSVETRLERLPGRLGPARSFDGTLAVGVLNYVQDLEGALRSLTSVLRPGGWTVFNVPARTAEGRIYALAEIANRRRIYLYSLPEIVKLGKKIGLRVASTRNSRAQPGRHHGRGQCEKATFLGREQAEASRPQALIHRVAEKVNSRKCSEISSNSHPIHIFTHYTAPQSQSNRRR